MRRCNRKSVYLLRIGWLFVALVVIGIWMWGANRPAFTWYVSQPLDLEGHRAKVMVPRGWTLNDRESHLLNGLLEPQGRLTLVFEAKRLMLPHWLRNLLRQPEEPDTKLYVDVGHRLSGIGCSDDCPADGIEEVGTVFMSNVFLATRVIKAGKQPLYGMVALTNLDRQRFDALHSTLCKSFRIE